MGYIWQLNKRGEREEKKDRDRQTEKGDQAEVGKKRERTVK